MGLFDKIKDLFTDEEDVYEDDKEDNIVKIKEIKNEDKKKDEILDKTSEHKLPTFMREKIEQEEKVKTKVEEERDVQPDFNVSSRVNTRINNNMYTDDIVEIPKKDENSFKFPVEFDDSDFVPRRSKSISTITELETPKAVTQTKKFEYKEAKKDVEKPLAKEKKVADLYKNKKEKEDEHKFQATPIISPIYGVLDKNYSKDQIKEASEDSYEIKRTSISKNIDFESVRKKAYGSLTDDIKENLMCENCELLKEAKVEQRKKCNDDNLVYQVLSDDEKKDDITLETATENYYDYGVEYESPKVHRSDKYIDEDEEVIEKEEVKIVNSIEEDKPKKDVPPVKSSINLLSTLKKSMGEEDDKIEEQTKTNKAYEKKDLELTDDLFNLIDSMYDERND